MKSARKQAMIVLAFLVSVILFAGSVPFQARAETTLERLQRAKAEKDKTEEELGSTQNKKDSLQNTQNSLLGQLSSLNDNLVIVSDNLAQLEKDIINKEAEIAQTQADLTAAIQKEENQYAAMKKRIQFMYERGDAAYLEMLFSSKSFGEFLNKSEYIEKLNQYDRKMLEQYKETRKVVEDTKAKLETEMASLDALQKDTKAQQDKVAVMVKQTAHNVADYANQIADVESTIDTYEAMIEEQEQDIAALQKQYEEELALSRLAAQSQWRDISEVTFEEGDRTLLANLIYCEAGGEPYAGQVAVGAVVINRVLSSRYPNTVVGVIYQNKQFSPVGSGRLALALANNKATAKCYQAADEAMSGITNVGQCVYFRTPIEGLTGLRIGGHIFY